MSEHEDIKLDEALEAMGFREVNLGIEGVQAYQVDLDQMCAANAAAMEEVFGEPILTYTRRQAIDDGVLIQLSGPGFTGEEWIPQMVREVGIAVPTAITAEAWAEFVEMNPAAEQAGNDVKGRLWDLLWMFGLAARQSEESEVVFEFYCVIRPESSEGGPPNPEMGGASLVHLKGVIGGDDNGGPCVTLMLTSQD